MIEKNTQYISMLKTDEENEFQVISCITSDLEEHQRIKNELIAASEEIEIKIFEIKEIE